jgi:hypothetical protein
MFGSVVPKPPSARLLLHLLYWWIPSADNCCALRPKSDAASGMVAAI